MLKRSGVYQGGIISEGNGRLPFSGWIKVMTMKLCKLILSITIILLSLVLCQQIITNSIANQRNKIDYAELNHIRYGLLSIDEWKEQITEILVAEVNKLDLSKMDEQELRKHVEVLLHQFIDKIDKKIREGNADSAVG